MYRRLVGNLRLRSAIPNISSLSENENENAHDELERGCRETPPNHRKYTLEYVLRSSWQGANLPFFYFSMLYSILGGDIISKGKQFEKLFREQVEALGDVYCFRIVDYSTFMGIMNPADFLAFHKPNMYMIECKTTAGASLPFKNISDYQLKSLWESFIKYSIDSYIIVWYYDKEACRAIPISVVKGLIDEGKKSIRYDYGDNRIIEITGKKKRVYYEWDWKPLFMR